MKASLTSLIQRWTSLSHFLSTWEVLVIQSLAARNLKAAPRNLNQNKLSDSGSDSECGSECDSEHADETSDPETNDEEIEDDSVPLYNGAKVSRLGALILVMLFSLRHQLSGKALIDFVKVLHALLPDGHKFVTSAYLLKKYFADLFGEPAPTRHSYCGNCLGRIRKGQAECLKAKCQSSKKKIGAED